MEPGRFGDEMIEIVPDKQVTEDDDISINEPTSKSDGGGKHEDAAAIAETQEVQSKATENENLDFDRELKEMEEEEHDLEIMAQIGDSLTKQMDMQMMQIPDSAETSFNEELFEDIDSNGNDDGNNSTSKEPSGKKKERLFGIIPWWIVAVSIPVAVIGAVVLWFAFSDLGQSLLIRIGSSYVADKVDYRPVEATTAVDVPDEIDDVPVISGEVTELENPVVTPEATEVITPEPTESEGAAAEAQEVYNVLLVGEENMNSGGARGRSDLIMVASINTVKGNVKLTSIMRDSLVAINGYSDNRINASYAIGGIALLYDTLSNNLNINLDNYILINFSSFEQIIDILGGVDIELTEKEAKYLNSTNYISNPAFRNVTKGMNHLNGNQTLGYCRIRNVNSAANEYGDFGRTSRQRAVIGAIAASVEKLNYFELLSLANKCLPLVTTDLDVDDIDMYISTIADESFNRKTENLRIPIEGSYSNVYLRNMLVTKIDLQTNSEAFREFVYGADAK